MPTIFSTVIANGSAATVYTDDHCSVILDIRPANKGHCLVIPQEEIDHWTDLPSDLNAHLFDVAQKIGAAQKKVFDCERIGMMIAGFEVPHAHIHLIPLRSMSDFELGSVAADADELAEVAERLQSVL